VVCHQWRWFAQLTPALHFVEKLITALNVAIA
jgi:hypothetical protein